MIFKEALKAMREGKKLDVKYGERIVILKSVMFGMNIISNMKLL